MFSAMNRTALVSSVLVLVATLTTGCVTEGEADLAPADPGADSDLGSDDTDSTARSRPRFGDPIAVIGAGPSGLSAALKLKELGYTNVTVFERENRVGGKVHTLNANGLAAELGAVFASPDYTEVLRLAQQFGVRYAEYTTPRFTLDEQGRKLTAEQFLGSRYTLAQLQAAVAAYASVLTSYRPYFDQNGFADLPDELTTKTFQQFADEKGFAPIAELAKSIIVGFGYSHYDTMPAIYGMKILPWLVKVGPGGLQQPTYYTFPTGFQSLWTAVASQLNVRLSSPVTRIERLSRDRARVTVDVGADGNPANDTTQTFEAVIISIPLNRVGSIMDLYPHEQYLFSKVDTDRYFVSLFTSPDLTRGETVFVHDTARKEQINHVNAWGNRDPASPVYIGYQLVDDVITAANVVATLAADVVNLGRATFGSVAFQKEWPDYFPSISTRHAKVGPFGYFDLVEDLQGCGDIYYVGGSLAFETVEHTARSGRAKVDCWFGGNCPPVTAAQ
jgi:oxygen-dependent protoporphyrinogen oxidase